MKLNNEYFQMRGFTSRQCKIICMKYYIKGEAIKQIALNHVFNGAKIKQTPENMPEGLKFRYKAEQKKVSDVVARHQMYFFNKIAAKHKPTYPLGAKQESYYTEKELFAMDHGTQFSIDKTELKTLSYYEAD